MRPARGPRHNLPAEWTSFVGREPEVAQLASLLGQTRLLTLVGPGGIGKTRLAQRAAVALLDDYPDGVWLVELAGLNDATLVASAVAGVLAVGELAAHRPEAALAEYCRPRRMLLLLDNCEHLVEECARLVDRLLRAAPGLRVLATSRHVLGVVGQTVWQVPPLTLPAGDRPPAAGELGGFEAPRLFVERARAARPDFTVTDCNVAAVIAVCARLDGLPLAIELAAARARALSVEQIAEHLSDRFGLLSGGNRTALPRHQTLRAVVDWSHDLLTEPERVLLRRLSAFAGGWTLPAAVAVRGAITDSVPGPTSGPSDSGLGRPDAAPETLDVLTGLVDKSLVVADEQGGATRYRLLETIREYAAERLREAGEDGAIHRRLAEWALALAEEAEPGLVGPRQTDWVARLELEHDNLRLALGRLVEDGAAERALRLAGALWRFWDVRGYLGEGRSWLDRALALAPATARTAARAKALSGAGILAYLQGDYATARLLCEEGLRIRRELGDQRTVAGSLNNLGHLVYLRGEYAAARALLGECLELARAVDDRFILGYALNNLGLVAYHVGDAAAARPPLEESLDLFRAVGHGWGVAMALGYLGMAARARGELDAAQSLYGESLARRR